MYRQEGNLKEEIFQSMIVAHLKKNLKHSQEKITVITVIIDSVFKTFNKKLQIDIQIVTVIRM